MNLKALKYQELVSLKKEIEVELKSRPAIGIRCCECGKAFIGDANKHNNADNEHGALWDAYVHLKKAHSYPEEDAGISAWNERYFIYE